MGKTSKSEKSDKKTSGDKKSSKAVKGSIGFAYGGCLKTGMVRVFASDDAKPETTFSELADVYGKSINGRYVACENPDNQFEKLKAKLAESHEGGNMYATHCSSLVGVMKELVGAKTAPRLGSKPAGDKKKSSKKSKKEDGSDSDSDSDSDSGAESDSSVSSKSSSDSDAKPKKATKAPEKSKSKK